VKGKWAVIKRDRGANLICTFIGNSIHPNNCLMKNTLVSGLVIVCLIGLPSSGWCQGSFADSLASISLHSSDSARLEILVEVFNKYSSQNYDRARIAGYQVST
jgi:hypothetical protein